jgi:tetratricopeptide (TPR) repeat protein
MEGARALLQRAIALDSNFFPAYGMLAVTYSNRGQWDDAERVARRMDEMAVRLSASEREMLDGVHAILRGDNQAAIRVSRRTAERDSNPVFLYIAGVHANNSLKPSIALPALEASDSVMLSRGWVAQATNLAEAYRQAAMYEKELAYVQRTHRLFPASVPILGNQLMAFAGLRRPAEAIALADTVLRGISDSIGVASAQWVLLAGLQFRSEGDTATCMRLARAVESWYAAHPLARPMPARAIEQGRVELTLGRLDSAQLWFERAMPDTSRIDAAGYFAVVRARRGDTARARAMADSIGAIQRKWTFGAPAFWRGAILGTVGDKELATQLLARSAREGQSMRGWRGHPALESLAGYPSFEQLVKPELRQ